MSTKGVSTVVAVPIKRKPKILAISTTFIISTPEIQRIIDLSKRYSPTTKIMVGGQYLFTSSDSINQLTGVDLFLLGECEDNLVPVVRALISNDQEELGNIKGIVYKKGEEFI